MKSRFSAFFCLLLVFAVTPSHQAMFDQFEMFDIGSHHSNIDIVVEAMTMDMDIDQDSVEAKEFVYSTNSVFDTFFASIAITTDIFLISAEVKGSPALLKFNRNDGSSHVSMYTMTFNESVYSIGPFALTDVEGQFVAILMAGVSRLIAVFDEDLTVLYAQKLELILSGVERRLTSVEEEGGVPDMFAWGDSIIQEEGNPGSYNYYHSSFNIMFKLYIAETNGDWTLGSQGLFFSEQYSKSFVSFTGGPSKMYTFMQEMDTAETNDMPLYISDISEPRTGKTYYYSLTLSTGTTGDDVPSALGNGPFLMTLDGGKMVYAFTAAYPNNQDKLFLSTLESTSDHKIKGSGAVYGASDILLSMEAVPCNDGMLIYYGNNMLFFNSSLEYMWGTQIASNWFSASIQSVTCFTDDILVSGWNENSSNLFFTHLNASGQLEGTTEDDWMYTAEIVAPVAQGTFNTEQDHNGEITQTEVQIGSEGNLALPNFKMTSEKEWTVQEVYGNAPMLKKFIPVAEASKASSGDNTYDVDFSIPSNLFSVNLGQFDLTPQSLEFKIPTGTTKVSGTVEDSNDNFVGAVMLKVAYKALAGFGRTVSMDYYMNKSSTTSQFTSLLCGSTAGQTGGNFCSANQFLTDLNYDATGNIVFTAMADPGQYFTGSLSSDGSFLWQMPLTLTQADDFVVKMDPYAIQKAVVANDGKFGYVTLNEMTVGHHELSLPYSCSDFLIDQTVVYCFDGYHIFSLSKLTWQIMNSIELSSTKLPTTSWTYAGSVVNGSGEIMLVATSDDGLYITTLDSDLTFKNFQQMSDIEMTNITIALNGDTLWITGFMDAVVDVDADDVNEDLVYLLAYDVTTPASSKVYTLGFPEADGEISQGIIGLAIDTSKSDSLYISYGTQIAYISSEEISWSQSVVVDHDVSCLTNNLLISDSNIIVGLTCFSSGLGSTTILLSLNAKGESTENGFVFSEKSTDATTIKTMDVGTSEMVTGIPSKSSSMLVQQEISLLEISSSFPYNNNSVVAISGDAMAVISANSLSSIKVTKECKDSTANEFEYKLSDLVEHAPSYCFLSLDGSVMPSYIQPASGESYGSTVTLQVCPTKDDYKKTETVPLNVICHSYWKDSINLTVKTDVSTSSATMMGKVFLAIVGLLLFLW